MKYEISYDNLDLNLTAISQMIPEQITKLFGILGALVSIFSEREFYKGLESMDEEELKKEV